jgi:exodeoxyribonuclease VII small subunit
MSSRTPSAPTNVDSPSPDERPRFEAMLKRLTEIVELLEKGDLALEDSVRLFEEGVKIARSSRQCLDSAERRVEELLSVDDQGRTRTSAFATELRESLPEDK